MAFETLDPASETSRAVQTAIEEKITNAKVVVRGSGGHFEIEVQASMFEGKSTLEKQRLVYRAIAKLMSGENAPVHAVDRLETSTPKTKVTITENAQAEVKRLIEAESKQGIGLRVAIRGGGCSGLSYGLDFTEKRDGDAVTEYDGFLLFVDPKSSDYLSGVALDYRGGLFEKGFVFQNPNATNTCGCGESFAL